MQRVTQFVSHIRARVEPEETDDLATELVVIDGEAIGVAEEDALLHPEAAAGGGDP